MIFFLSTNPQSRIPGWAYKSRVSFADDLGVSKQSILNLVKSLEEKGLIEKNPVSAFLRTTETWNKVYFTTGKESLPGGGKETCYTGKESLPHAGKESLPYNNSIDNNNDILNINAELKNSAGIGNISLPVKDKKKKESTKKAGPLIEGFTRDETIDIYGCVKAYFLEFYRANFHTEYYFEPKNAAKVYSIIKKVLFKMKETNHVEAFTSQEITDATNMFIRVSLLTADNFLQSNFNLSTIDSKFNDIYTKIKNKQHGNIKKPSIRDSAANRFSS